MQKFNVCHLNMRISFARTLNIYPNSLSQTPFFPLDLTFSYCKREEGDVPLLSRPSSFFFQCLRIFLLSSPSPLTFSLAPLPSLHCVRTHKCICACTADRTYSTLQHKMVEAFLTYNLFMFCSSFCYIDHVISFFLNLKHLLFFVFVMLF